MSVDGARRIWHWGAVTMTTRKNTALIGQQRNLAHARICYDGVAGHGTVYSIAESACMA